MSQRFDFTYQLALEGASLEDIVRFTFQTPAKFYRFLQDSGLKTHWKRAQARAVRQKLQQERADLVYQLVREGATYREIAAVADISREWVHVHILETGQYSLWRKKRQEVYHHRRQQRQREVIQEHKRQRSIQREMKQAYERLVKDHFQHPGTYRSMPLSTKVTLLERYELARQRSETRSLEELTRGLMTFPMGGMILHAAGLEPMYGCNTKQSKEFYRQRTDLLRNSFSIPMSGTDMAYFLGTSHTFVTPQLKRNVLYHPLRVGKRNFSYRQASQMYQARDAGKSASAIASRLDLAPRVVNHILHHRPRIERTIIQALRHWFPEEKIDRPYRTPA